MLLYVLVALQGIVAAGEAPLDVADRKQLFIDRRFVAEAANIELRANPAQKLGLERTPPVRSMTTGSPKSAATSHGCANGGAL